MLNMQTCNVVKHGQYNMLKETTTFLFIIAMKQVTVKEYRDRELLAHSKYDKYLKSTEPKFQRKR